MKKRNIYLQNSDRLDASPDELYEILIRNPIGFTHECPENKGEDVLVCVVDTKAKDWKNAVPDEIQCFRCKWRTTKDVLLGAWKRQQTQL